MGCAELLSVQGDQGSAPPPARLSILLSLSGFPLLISGQACQWFLLLPPLFAHPRASSLSSRQTSPAPSSPRSSFFSAALQPFDPTQKPEKKKSCISTQIYHEWSLCSLSQESMCVFVCVNSVWMRENYPARVRYYL